MAPSLLGQSEKPTDSHSQFIAHLSSWFILLNSRTLWQLKYCQLCWLFHLCLVCFLSKGIYLLLDYSKCFFFFSHQLHKSPPFPSHVHSLSPETHIYIKVSEGTVLFTLKISEALSKSKKNVQEKHLWLFLYTLQKNRYWRWHHSPAVFSHLPILWKF